MIEKVFIVTRIYPDGIQIVESVWSTWELANAAIEYHAMNSNSNRTGYLVLEREVNKAHASK